MQIWGFDIGTTSIGWAVIEHEFATSTGRILGMGVRIFPEARDPKGTPLNQTRRQKRLARRQLRRRRERRKTLNQALADADLLPAFSKDQGSEWARVMALPPLPIRERALRERVELHEFGRALYHLAKRRHFKEPDLNESDISEVEDAAEKAACDARNQTIKELKASGKTLGESLSTRFPVQGDRTRGIKGAVPSSQTRRIHALRSHVVAEFERLWSAQALYHPALTDVLKTHIFDVMFVQKPVFWRKNTLGQCRLMPGEELAPKGSWLSQQRRMLEKLNNLEVASGNRRPLDQEERTAILARLQVQASMSWGGVRKALTPLFTKRGEKGLEQRIRFNLEIGGEPKLLGNPLEAKLAGIFGDGWAMHPHRQAIRDAIHHRLWSADYAEVGQRVVILPAAEREIRRATAAERLKADFDITNAQATELTGLALPTGWEPFSTKALEVILPELERGERFGTLMVSPECARWREATFPNREAPTGEVLDRLPSPARRKLPNGEWDSSEQDRIKAIRNPTVARTQNELRKVVNNLIDAFGKPDLIRIELAREVGLSKREREERQTGIRKNASKRADAKKDLETKGISQPSARDIDKWVLWKESGECCPYTGEMIGFDALFRQGAFEIEHIWPRSRSLDDSQGNKTLCRRDINIAKGNRTPFEFFQSRPDDWNAVKLRLDKMIAGKNSPGLPRGKVRRFLAETMPDDFANRQLTDTGYAARQAVALLKRLWPDVGEPSQAADFGLSEELRRRKVLPVTGRVTAQLRKLWGLNNILSDDGEKTRADHRHHAIDALVVACTDPGMTQRLSHYWQQKDVPHAERPHLPPPWPGIRENAELAVKAIIVSHRVRKKVSGPLHKETVYGDTGQEIERHRITYRQVVTRKPLAELSKTELGAIRDTHIREMVTDWVKKNGGDPKKAFGIFPRNTSKDSKVQKDRPEIHKARIIVEQQPSLMAPVATGRVSLGNNHHLAIYRTTDGKIDWRIVSMMEAAQRLARHQPIVTKALTDGSTLVMSISLGDTVCICHGEKAGYWIANILSANGQIFFRRAEDASGESKWGPNANTLFKENACKLSVDPIGRVRPAND
ncbi:MAG: type II CRISPR RNA-guided endonuclease Cas9 [Alphaproteobacteria bacterium]|nr:type II CRISPR RNA-guided endonuclease Cas9 [Alphaproteobacteria bacterium]